MAISIDGADAATHDTFRQVDGSFDRCLFALHHAREIGLETQMQTTVTRRNMHQLDRIADLTADAGCRMWSLFFLIVTGRALAADDLTAEEYEEVFERMYRISKRVPFDMKTTEAMHYRRFLAQKHQEDGSSFRTAGVSDGRGFVFISHRGEIYPSGFLEVSGGNVRRDRLTDVYRDSQLFRVLRDPKQREGKCGDCEYVKVCGGSRARAYATTGNYLAEEPRCVYEPARKIA